MKRLKAAIVTTIFLLDFVYALGCTPANNLCEKYYAVLVVHDSLIPLYQTSCMKRVLHYLYDDSVKEQLYCLTLLDKTETAFKVEAKLCDENSPEKMFGWIDKRYVGVYINTNSAGTFPLYIQPSMTSDYEVIQTQSNILAEIMDCFKLWYKISFELNGRTYVGWLPREYQYTNPY